jgi:hypothetical protein
LVALVCLLLVTLHQDKDGRLVTRIACETWESLTDAYRFCVYWLSWPQKLVLLALLVGMLAFARRACKPKASIPGNEAAPEASLTRRAFLVTSVSAAGALGYGNQVGRYDLGLTRRRVDIRGLPARPRSIFGARWSYAIGAGRT